MCNSQTHALTLGIWTWRPGRHGYNVQKQQKAKLHFTNNKDYNTIATYI